MTAKQKTAQEYQSNFDIASCIAMTEKMTKGHWEGGDCEEMMAQFTGEEDIPEEWPKVMSQMVEVHCVTQEDREKVAQHS